MASVDNTLLIMFFDAIGELITPTANFTPASGSSLANLKNNQLFSRCRTPDLTTDRQLTWDLGSAITANAFALIGTNATKDVTRRFRGADDSGFTSNVIQSGSSLAAGVDSSLGISMLTYVPPWGRTLLYIHPTSFAKRYIRWHQTDSGNGDGYMEWGIARVGLGWQPLQGFQDPKVSINFVGDPGAEIPRRGIEVLIHNLSLDESLSLQATLSVVKRIRRMLVTTEALTPATFPHQALWCVIESATDRESIVNTGYADKRYRYKIVFREVSQ